MPFSPLFFFAGFQDLSGTMEPLVLHTDSDTGSTKDNQTSTLKEML